MNITNEMKKRLTYLGLGTDQLVRIGGKNIPRSFIRLFIIFSSLLFCILESILCIKFSSDNLVKCLMALNILASMLPVAPIYITLVLKTDEINDLLNYLEIIISTSNRKLFFKWYSIRIQSYENEKIPLQKE